MAVFIEKKEFAKRLNQAFDLVGVPAKYEGRQTSVAKRYKISQTAARNWLEGESIPKFVTLNKIAMDTNCDVEWLISGRGKGPGDQNLSIGEINESTASYHVSSKHKKLISLFNDIPTIEQDEIMNQLQEKKEFYDNVIKELLERREDKK